MKKKVIIPVNGKIGGRDEGENERIAIVHSYRNVAVSACSKEEKAEDDVPEPKRKKTIVEEEPVEEVNC